MDLRINTPPTEIRRGDVWYVQPSYINPTMGHEMRAGRPAVVVSNDRQNQISSVFEVVYLTTTPKHDYPTHVTLHCTGRQSTALCENIDTVDFSRFTGYCGSCSETEMTQIDLALLISLDLTCGKVKERVVEVEKIIEVPTPTGEEAMLRAQVEALQELYRNLLLKTATV